MQRNRKKTPLIYDVESETLAESFFISICLFLTDVWDYIIATPERQYEWFNSDRFVLQFFFGIIIVFLLLTRLL